MVPKVSDEYREERRRALVQAALACFGEKGYELTTVDDIVSKASVSKGFFYTYFPSKEEIFRSVLRERTDKYIHDLKAGMDRQPNIWNKVLIIVRRYAGASLNEQQRREMAVHFEFFLTASRDEERHALLEHRRRILVSLLAEQITEGIKAGEFHHSVNAETASTLYWALCDGINLHFTQFDGAPDYQTMFVAAESMLYQYLRHGA